MSFPRRGRVTIRWSKSENDWLVAWGPGPGRLNGRAGGFLALVIGGAPLFPRDNEDPSTWFASALQEMGFDHTKFRAYVDVMPMEDEQ